MFEARSYTPHARIRSQDIVLQDLSLIVHRFGIRLVKAPKVAVCFYLDSMHPFVAQKRRFGPIHRVRRSVCTIDRPPDTHTGHILLNAESCTGVT